MLTGNIKGVPPQVSAGEVTAASGTSLRSFSPADVAKTALRPLVDTAANLATVIPEAGRMVYETDTGRARRGDGTTAVASLGYVPGLVPIPDLTSTVGAVPNWRHPYPLIPGGTLTVTAQREYWTLLQWRGRWVATDLGILVTTGLASNIVVSAYACTSTGTIGAQLGRVVLDGTLSGIKGATPGGMSIVPMQYFWACVWADAAVIVDATRTSGFSESWLGIVANAPVSGLYRTGITPIANAAPSTAPAFSALSDSSSTMQPCTLVR